ncbi:hypothetical protein [Latilactobacillus graminis]|uniref:DUF443 family protein n=1 Tax=Latilactobacillus graminis TaxID=60519 RepID=A0ABX6C9R9_9LACO|nr:hypothetical protein [Latilactobacillus graminis]QFP79512.1 hypothetical protein LG542_04375 [Latilactobacillus graminis]
MFQQTEFQIIAKISNRYRLVKSNDLFYIVDVANYKKIATYFPLFSYCGLAGYSVSNAEAKKIIKQTKNLKEKETKEEIFRNAPGIIGVSALLGIYLARNDLIMDNTGLVRIFLIAMLVILVAIHVGKLRQDQPSYSNPDVTFIPLHLWANILVFMLQITSILVIAICILSRQISMMALTCALMFILLIGTAPYFTPKQQKFYYKIK